VSHERMPLRTTGWSSASSTRIFFLRLIIAMSQHIPTARLNEMMRAASPENQ
jgi:hypothetical protein